MIKLICIKQHLLDIELKPNTLWYGIYGIDKYNWEYYQIFSIDDNKYSRGKYDIRIFEPIGQYREKQILSILEEDIKIN
jgi:hypothetical protein